MWISPGNIVRRVSADELNEILGPVGVSADPSSSKILPQDIETLYN